MQVADARWPVRALSKREPGGTIYLKIAAKKPPILPKNPLCAAFFAVTVVGRGVLGTGAVGSVFGAVLDFAPPAVSFEAAVPAGGRSLARKTIGASTRT